MRPLSDDPMGQPLLQRSTEGIQQLLWLVVQDEMPGKGGGSGGRMALHAVQQGFIRCGVGDTGDGEREPDYQRRESGHGTMLTLARVRFLRKAEILPFECTADWKDAA